MTASARARLALALTLIAVLASTVVPGTGRAQSTGDPVRGESTFAAKQCARCHQRQARAGVGPALETLRRPQGAYELAGRMWNHAPGMYTVLNVEGVEWPRINPTEMADLMAYLLANPTRDPPISRAKGQLILVNKGCLKCHTWKGEGARIGPELSERRASFAPAATWASAMWAHAPRMAAVAIQHGILYPRFTGDEMRQLLGYLGGQETAQ